MTADKSTSPQGPCPGHAPFRLPAYHEPDFSSPALASAPDARLAVVEQDGVAPEGFHSTSMYPEYVKLRGSWHLVPETRMDASVIVREGADGAPSFDVQANRALRRGDRIVLGRSEDGSEGVLVHAHGFDEEAGARDAGGGEFVFRQGRSRETSFARDYDRLIELLRHEREHGNVLWVMGPAFAFDYDARRFMQAMIEAGYVDGVLAGNALATHDLEAAHLHTALGQDIYTQRCMPSGHHNHLDVINRVRRCGSIAAFIDEYHVDNGIMYQLERSHVPYVLAGSIRDDGPLPEVVGNVYEAQDRMRDLVRSATTVICLATMLHTIATGNLTPSFRVTEDGTVRPLYLYAVDAAEFVVNKLQDRGSLSATAIVTNVQDFITIVAKGLGVVPAAGPWG
jgi:lysine-ketoglutarate reductase/saccharopine dehydrogenase-like protein (TIGR00300 family)